MIKTNRYYLVEAGVITEGPSALQGSWQNYTHMELRDDVQKMELGWLPEYEARAVLGANETWDAPTRQIQADRVVLSYPARAMTAAEKAEASQEAAIGGDSLLAQLKAMSAAEFDTWFAGLSASNKDALLKRITRVIIRRVL